MIHFLKFQSYKENKLSEEACKHFQFLFKLYYFLQFKKKVLIRLIIYNYHILHYLNIKNIFLNKKHLHLQLLRCLKLQK